MYSLLLLVLFILSLSSQVNTARILAVFPTPSISHQVIFEPLTQGLASRGHDVTVITPNPVFTNDKRTNLTEIGVYDSSYNLRDNFRNIITHTFGDKNSACGHMLNGVALLADVVASQLKTDAVQNLINNASIQFDLLLVEAWTRHALIYSHIFKAPVIQISSFGMMLDNEENVGAPIHPILYPAIFQQKLYNLTFWDKFNTIYDYLWLRKQMYSRETEEIHRFRDIVGSDLPYYDDLKNNVDMLFLNSHPVWMDNQPLPPNVISIWGIHKKPDKPLPKDLQDYLDSSKHGVIYISFGSNVPSSALPPVFIQLLIRIFSKLPYDVLWKWETDALPGKSKNIRIAKWLPQSDLLKHPKIKLFITQGGLQSTDEAITAGVPLIGIPMLGDQWYNVEKYEYHRIGIKLDMETINDDKFEAAILSVINDKSYRENIIKLRTVMKDQPSGALERAVWWTEYVLRHGGAKHLRARAANMPWTQYYEIDFVLKLLVLACTFLILLSTALYLLWKQLIKKLPQKIKMS